MPLPLILIGIGVAAGGGGVGLGGWGASDLVKAKKRLARADRDYQAKRTAAEKVVEHTNAQLHVLGEQQQVALTEVVLRMGDFLRRHEKQVRESERLLVEGIDAAMQGVPGLRRLEVDAVAWIGGVIGSAATSVGVSSGVTAAVTAYATASTGTAISSLSGAAATNATLAVLGGGTLAEGGGGVALGATVLNVFAIGPALLVGGSMLKLQGSKALTHARKVEADINVAIAELDQTVGRLKAVDLRTDELGSLLNQLRNRGVTALDLLESEPFQPEAHAERFQRAMNLAMAVRDVAATPVVDASGDLSEHSGSLTIKYRLTAEDAQDD